MADRILGGSQPSTNVLFWMTEGLGKPLREVDGGDVPVEIEPVLASGSLVTQQPSALDVPLQLTFGSAIAGDEVTLDAAGNITFLESNWYSIYVRLNFGRQGAAQTSILFGRVLVNGIQATSSVFARLDDGNSISPATFVFPFLPNVNDVMTIEIMRSSQGVNAGGIFGADPAVSGWVPAASGVINITKFVATAS